MNAATIPLPVGYRPDWAFRYHGRDPEGLCERVEGSRLDKCVLIGGRPVVLTVEVGADRAVLTCHPTLHGEDCDTAEHIARRMLGLLGDPEGFEERAAREPAVARLMGDRRGFRLPLSATVFEGLTWAIVGQQVNLRFAGVLRRAVIELVGIRHPAGMAAHPTPDAVAGLEVETLAAHKFSRSKAAYLIGAARAIAEGRLDLEALAGLSAEDAAARFAGIKGCGPWTVAYVLLRAVGHPDVAPVGDAGLAAALQAFHGLDRRPTPEEQRIFMQPFAPHRSLATGHFWAGWS